MIREMILQINRVLPSLTTPGVCLDGHWMATLHRLGRCLGEYRGHVDLVLMETQDLVPMPLGGSTGMGWPGFLHHHPGPVTVGTFCGVPGRIGAFTSFEFFFWEDQSFDGKMGFDKSFDMTSTKV